MRDQAGRPFVKRCLDRLWFIVLSSWITLLVVLGSFFLERVGSLALRVVVILVSSLAGIAVSWLLYTRSASVSVYRRQAGQFHSFCKAIKKAAGTLELQEILDSAARVVAEVTGVRGCSIKLLDPANGKMRARTVAGLDKRQADEALNIVENIYERGTLARESIIVRDIYMRDFPAVSDEFESLICVPLRLEERLLGAICIFGERGQRLSPEMIALLSSLGDVVSLAIAHSLVYEDLKDLVQTKTRFMFQASHELRSPLTSIQSMARALSEGHLGPLTDRQQEMLNRIDIRSQTLSEVVGDLLTLAVGRAELATLKPVRVDLVKLAREALGFNETRAQDRSVELELVAPLEEAPVKGSEDGLRSVLTNLLSNAIKYTPAGGKVTLRLSEAKEQLVLEISDTGIGIPEEEQTSLFEEFFRASNAKAMSHVGTGLGLAIVKATVQQHGGLIEVKSEVGQGTTFRIVLNKAGA